MLPVGKPCRQDVLSYRRRKPMKPKIVRTIALGSLAAVVGLGTLLHAQAQDPKPQYPSMAPLDQYMIADRNAEVALARSAGPESISHDAEVLVLGRHGYESAVKGKNGFVCMVQRSWAAGIEDAEFWNPKLRAPICFNPPAARSYAPLIIKKAEWVLAGQSKTQISDSLKAGFDKKDLPALEPDAMCYMLSKQGYLSDHDGHWHPHVMFFVPQTGAATWGANLPGSPILASESPSERLTIFLIP